MTFNCPKSICKGKSFGQWSDVSVNFGTPSTTPFQITITVAASELPANPDLTKLVVFHVLDDNKTVETISQLCGSGAPPAIGLPDPDVRHRRQPGDHDPQLLQRRLQGRLLAPNPPRHHRTGARKGPGLRCGMGSVSARGRGVQGAEALADAGHRDQSPFAS